MNPIPDSEVEARISELAEHAGISPARIRALGSRVRSTTARSPDDALESLGVIAAALNRVQRGDHEALALEVLRSTASSPGGTHHADPFSLRCHIPSLAAMRYANRASVRTWRVLSSCRVQWNHEDEDVGSVVGYRVPNGGALDMWVRLDPDRRDLAAAAVYGELWWSPGNHHRGVFFLPGGGTTGGMATVTRLDLLPRAAPEFARASVDLAVAPEDAAMAWARFRKLNPVAHPHGSPASPQ